MNKRFSIPLIWILLLSITFACIKEPVPPPEPVIDRVTIAGLRDLQKQGVGIIDSNIYIQGVVTLTPELGNLPGFVAYVQDSTAGICLTVTGDNTFSLNSEVRILCRGVSFTEYNGLLQFGDINISEQVKVVKLTAEPPAPVTVTLQDLLDGKHQAELVKIEHVQFKDPGNYSGTKILTDCEVELDVYTRSDATFASETLPSGNGTFKGVVSVFNDVQLLLREPDELEMTGDRCGLAGVVYLQEDFNSLARYQDVTALPGWKSFSETGNKSWYINEVSARKWVQATAYNSNQTSVITWMIAPPVNLTQAVKPYLSFESANGYDNGATLELYVSKDYNGSATPWNSTWTKLNFSLPQSSPSGYSQFVASGEVDLTPFKGSNVYFAWKYSGGDPSGTASDRTTTWEVDNVLIGER